MPQAYWPFGPANFWSSMHVYSIAKWAGSPFLGEAWRNVARSACRESRGRFPLLLASIIATAVPKATRAMRTIAGLSASLAAGVRARVWSNTRSITGGIHSGLRRSGMKGLYSCRNLKSSADAPLGGTSWKCTWTAPLTVLCAAGSTRVIPLAPDGFSTPRAGQADKTVMGASRTGSYQVTSSGRAHAGGTQPQVFTAGV